MQSTTEQANDDRNDFDHGHNDHDEAATTFAEQVILSRFPEGAFSGLSARSKRYIAAGLLQQESRAGEEIHNPTIGQVFVALWKGRDVVEGDGDAGDAGCGAAVKGVDAVQSVEPPPALVELFKRPYFG